MFQTISTFLIQLLGHPERLIITSVSKHAPSDCVIPEYLALKVQVDLLSTSTRSRVHVKDSETTVWHNLSVG